MRKEFKSKRVKLSVIFEKRVKLSVIFEEFDMVYFFWLLFPFHYHCQLVKGKLQQNSGFYGPELKIIIFLL